MNSNYRNGDLILVDLGEPPVNVKGHEQGKTRPCVVIKSLNQLGLLIVLPVTSKTPKKSFYTIVKIEKGKAGLNKDSFVLCHQIRTISTERVNNSSLSQLDNIDFNKIKAVLLDTLEL